MNIFRRLRHVAGWLPIIWKDEDWDWSYLVVILRHKLDTMQSRFSHSKYFTVRKRAKRIRYCKLLADRLLADEYGDMAFRPHYAKWGEPELVFHDDHHLEIRHANVITPEDEERETAEFRRCHQHEEYMRKQDIDELFGTMKKYIRNWWD